MANEDLNEGVEIMVPPNIRSFSDYDTDLDFSAGKRQKHVVLNSRHLRSNGIKSALFDGRLRVVKGCVEFPYKDSTIHIDGKEGGNEEILIISPTGKMMKTIKTGKITKV